jgi:hypothetical protein
MSSDQKLGDVLKQLYEAKTKDVVQIRFDDCWKKILNQLFQKAETAVRFVEISYKDLGLETLTYLDECIRDTFERQILDKILEKCKGEKMKCDLKIICFCESTCRCLPNTLVFDLKG